MVRFSANPGHIDTISKEFPILYFKGSKVFTVWQSAQRGPLVQCL